MERINIANFYVRSRHNFFYLWKWARKMDVTKYCDTYVMFLEPGKNSQYHPTLNTNFQKQKYNSRDLCSRDHLHVPFRNDPLIFVAHDFYGLHTMMFHLT